MSRLFPRGNRIVVAHQPDLPHLRIVAGASQDGSILSLMLVNNDDEGRTVVVSIPGAGRKTMRRYNYFDADRPTDAEGFAVPKETVPEVDLEVGVKITMPSRGVVFLSAS